MIRELGDINSDVIFEAWTQSHERSFELIYSILALGSLSTLSAHLEKDRLGSYSTSILISTVISLAFRSEDIPLLDHICEELENSLVGMSIPEQRTSQWNTCLYMTIKFLHDKRAWSYASKLRDTLLEMRPRVLGAYDWPPKVVRDLDEIDSDVLCEAWAQCHEHSFELIRSILALGSLSTLSAYLETRPRGCYSTNLLISTVLNLAFRAKDAKLLDHICDELEAVLFIMSDSEVRLLCWSTCLESTTQFLQDDTSWPYASKLRDTLVAMRPRVLDSTAEKERGIHEQMD